MPTIIDSLIVSLSLDPSGFTEGQKSAAASMLKTKDAALKQSKELEEANKKFADSFNFIKVQAAELFAVIAGTSSIKAFVTDITNATAALGRLSANINVSPQELGAWGAAIERIGGNAEEAAADFQTLSQQLFDLRQNGKNIPESLQKMGAEARVPIDYSHGLPAYLHSLATAASELTRLHGGDRSDSFNFLKQAGIGPGMAQVLIDNGAALDKYIASLKNFAPTDDQIKKFESLQTAFIGMQQEATKAGRDILTNFTPMMEGATKAIGDFVKQNEGAWTNTAVEGVKEFNDAWKEVRDLLIDVGDRLNAINAAVSNAGKSLHDKVFGPSKTQGDPTGLTSMDPLGGLNYIANGAGADFRNWVLKQIGPSAAHADTLDNLTPGRGNSGPHPSGGTTSASGGNSGPHPAPGLFIQGQQVSRGNPMPVTLVQSETGSGGGLLSWLFGGGSPTSQGGGAAAGGGIIANAAKGLANLIGGTGGGSPYTYQDSPGSGALTKLITEAAKEAGIDPRIMEGIRAGESRHDSKYDIKDDALESSWGPFQLNRRRGLGVAFEKDTGLDVRDPKTIPAQAKWVAEYIKAHNGTNGQWMGYRGERDADPKWGDAGYTPSSAIGTGPTPVSRSGAMSPGGGPWVKSGGREYATDAAGNIISGTSRPLSGGSIFSAPHRPVSHTPLSTMSALHPVTTSSTSNSWHIDHIAVNAGSATNAHGIADRIADALRSSSMTTGANFGQA